MGNNQGRLKLTAYGLGVQQPAMNQQTVLGQHCLVRGGGGGGGMGWTKGANTPLQQHMSGWAMQMLKYSTNLVAPVAAIASVPHQAAESSLQVPVLFLKGTIVAGDAAGCSPATEASPGLATVHCCSRVLSTVESKGATTSLQK